MTRNTKKEKRRLLIISIVLCALVVALFNSVYSDFIKIINNTNDVEKLTAEYENLLDEQKSLSSEVTKMQDPDYVARYAKEKYLYSDEDEIIIRID